MAHTPTPWYVIPQPWDSSGCVVGTAPDPHRGVVICATDEMQWHGYTPAKVKEWRANAEFIVRACNAHDELVASCEAAHSLLRSGMVGIESGRFEMELVLEEAIAKAKGSE